MNIKKTTTANPSFLQLEKLLDAELRKEYPEEIDQYTPHNKFKQAIKAIIFTKEDKAIACGAMKELGDHIEIKRMFVHPQYRGQGLSKKVLTALEDWGKSLGYNHAILETGDRLHKAINLYQSSGYKITPNYGPYVHLENSVCMKKTIG